MGYVLASLDHDASNELAAFFFSTAWLFDNSLNSAITGLSILHCNKLAVLRNPAAEPGQVVS